MSRPQVPPPRVHRPRNTAPVRALALVGALLVSGCAGGDAAETPLLPLFSLAVIADPHITTNADHEARLAGAVDWLNEHAEERQIELSLVLGDIGWGAGLERSRELLDGLAMTWVPVIGDNEVHAGDDEAFNTVFQPHYQQLAEELDGWRKAPLPVADPSSDQDIWLQNMAFEHRGLQVFMLDFCIRHEEGILGEFGDLHDYPGGTWPWLESELAALEPGAVESVVLASHIPLVLGAFDGPEMEVIRGLLEPHGGDVYANLAGHLHGNLLFPEAGYDAYLTDATWDDQNTVRVVQVLTDGTRFEYAHELVIVP